MVQCLSPHLPAVVSRGLGARGGRPLEARGAVLWGSAPMGGAAGRTWARGGLSCEGGADPPAGLQGLKQGDRQSCPELG